MGFYWAEQRVRFLLLLIMLVSLTTACSPEESNIQRGKQLFNQKHLGKNNVIGCVACHSIKPGQTIVGPSLAGLSIRAPYLVAGESAEEYIRHSIINPDAHIVEGFLPAVMFSHYAQELSQEEIDALVGYLSQL